jgi:hypothetical protein
VSAIWHRVDGVDGARVPWKPKRSRGWTGRFMQGILIHRAIPSSSIKEITIRRPACLFVNVETTKQYAHTPGRCPPRRSSKSSNHSFLSAIPKRYSSINTAREEDVFARFLFGRRSVLTGVLHGRGSLVIYDGVHETAIHRSIWRFVAK